MIESLGKKLVVYGESSSSSFCQKIFGIGSKVFKSINSRIFPTSSKKMNSEDVCSSQNESYSSDATWSTIPKYRFYISKLIGSPSSSIFQIFFLIFSSGLFGSFWIYSDFQASRRDYLMAVSKSFQNFLLLLENLCIIFT